MLPNRIALYLTAAAALLGGLAPVVANLDWQSTVGIATGLAAITAVVSKWLTGWQQYEALTALPVPSDEQLGSAPFSDKPITPDE